MRCSGIVAADGGSQVLVWPRGHARPGSRAHTAGLILTIDPACTSCKAGDACPFFPALARKLEFPCSSGIPAAERVSRPRSNLAPFEDPPGVRESGWSSGGPDPANGLVGYTGTALNGMVYRSTCTLPRVSVPCVPLASTTSSTASRSGIDPRCGLARIGGMHCEIRQRRAQGRVRSRVWLRGRTYAATALLKGRASAAPPPRSPHRRRR